MPGAAFADAVHIIENHLKANFFLFFFINASATIDFCSSFQWLAASLAFVTTLKLQQKIKRVG